MAGEASSMYDAGPCTQRERPAFGEEAQAEETRAMRGEARQLGLILAGLSTRGQCPLSSDRTGVSWSRETRDESLLPREGA